MSFLIAALASVAPCVSTGSHADSTRITAAALAPGASIVAIGLSDGEVRLLDLATRKPLLSMRGTSQASVARLTWSASGARLAAAVFAKPEANSGPVDAGQEYVDARGAWLVFDVATGKRIFERESESAGHDDPGLILSPDGKYLFTWGCEPPGRLWGVDSQHLRSQCAIKGARTTCAAWSSDGDTIDCGDDQGRISSWRASDGALRCEVTWAANRVECLAVSRDGRWLAAGGRPTALGVWESAGLESRWTRLLGEERSLGFFDDDRVVDVAFDSTAESVVATTNSWGTASAWATAGGRRRWIHDFQGGNEAKLYGSFDPRGERIATWGLGMSSASKVFAASSGSVRSVLDSRHVAGGRGSVGWTADGRFFIARTTAGLDVMDGTSLESLGTIEP